MTRGLIERGETLLGHMPGISDERDSVPLLLAFRQLWSEIKAALESRAPDGTLPLVDAAGNVRSLAEIEAEVIRFAIAHYRGHMSEVARRLGIGRSTLYRKIDGGG